MALVVITFHGFWFTTSPSTIEHGSSKVRSDRNRAGAAWKTRMAGENEKNKQTKQTTPNRRSALTCSS